MTRKLWNHNIHYYDLVLRAIPSRCCCALDAGCGQGLLAQLLAQRCTKVFAIDSDHLTISSARASASSQTNIMWVEGDLMVFPFPRESFDLIAVVSTLHHLPLRPALACFRDLLRPGGVLAVIGLYRANTLGDRALSAAAFPSSWAIRCVRGWANVAAPVRNARETLREIRTACEELLPGAVIQRRLLFRYSLIWGKP